VDDTRRQHPELRPLGGPIALPQQAEAKQISWKLGQASGVKANVCYLNQYNAYGKDLKE